MVITLIVTAFFKPGFLRKKHTPEEDTSDSMIYFNMSLKLNENEIAGAGYIDEEGEMHPIPHYYDWETGIVTIYTPHLSKYCGFPVNNERMSNAMLAYVFADKRLQQ